MPFFQDASVLLSPNIQMIHLTRNLRFFAIGCLAHATAMAQTTLNSSYFQTLSARALGPSTTSGRITAIEGVMVSDQLNLYVGTAGGGVWKSQNGGLSFTPIFDKYCQSIGAIAIEKNKGKVVYVGTGESNMRNTVSVGNGLYKTTDGGSNWQKIGLDSTEHISKILIDPTDANTLFVAGSSFASNENSLTATFSIPVASLIAASNNRALAARRS